MRVVGSRLLIRKLAQQQSAGLIEVVKFEDDPTNLAEIVAVGEYVENDIRKPLPDVSVGDKIVIKSFCGTPVEINYETLYFIEYNDAQAVIE